MSNKHESKGGEQPHLLVQWKKRLLKQIQKNDKCKILIKYMKLMVNEDKMTATWNPTGQTGRSVLGQQDWLDDIGHSFQVVEAN